jgi:hypothetical protein
LDTIIQALIECNPDNKGRKLTAPIITKPFPGKELLGHTSIDSIQIYVRQNPERLAEVYRPGSSLKELT